MTSLQVVPRDPAEDLVELPSEDQALVDKALEDYEARLLLQGPAGVGAGNHGPMPRPAHHTSARSSGLARSSLLRSAG